MKTLFKESIISVKKNLKRFLSILLIILLGVGFFVGIKTTSPDMKNTANEYFNESNMYDFFLASPWGVKETDIEYIKSKGYQAYGEYSKDVIVIKDNEEVAKLLSYDQKSNINNITLVEGRLPLNDSECVIEKNKYTELHKIGDVLEVNDEILKEKQLTIVGLVQSPLYISLEKGSTDLLSGTISYFLYSPKTNFNSKYYTEMFINVKSTLNRFSDDYQDLIDEYAINLKDITKYLSDIRYTEIVMDATNKLNDGYKEYEENKIKVNKELENALKLINQNETKLKEEERKLNTSINEWNTQKLSLIENLETLNNSKTNLLITLENLNDTISNLEETKTTLESLIYNEIEVESNSELLHNVTEQLNTLYENKESINNSLNEINTSINTINTTIIATDNKLTSSKKIIEESKIKLNNSKIEYEKNKKNALLKLDDALLKLENAKKDINNIEQEKWYVLDLNSNIGFYQYKADTERITNIAKVFPLIFFVVAILICSTTMTRLVEEERGQIGTYKSLGYSNFAIMQKYIIYALLATILGSIIGIAIGVNIIPKIIFNMYSMMYDVGVFNATFTISYMLSGTFIALLCTLGATLNACFKELNTVPAELLRPTAPKAGKRVLLERINFIWKRLKFSNKVTVRNVFRYKKRFLMTIIGIAGCTGLILAGFGLKDCIVGMVPNQYEKIFKYDAEIILDTNTTLNTKNNTLSSIKEISGVTNALAFNKESIELEENSTTEPIYLMVPFGDISEFIALQDRKKTTKIELDNKIAITEKIAKLLKLKVGSKIHFNNNTYEVGYITENYISHYIYMSESLYNSSEFNTILIKTDDFDKTKLTNNIKELSGVSAINYNSSKRDIFDSTMKNFGYVSLVLIVSAGLLAFVVLYNLASVNISERKRELASIKVLGFYDKEVYNYVDRESTILTTIGIIFGMLVGKVLTDYIIKTCELDSFMFDPRITLKSYVFSILITLVFTLIVDVTIYFSLKKIDMIESLKSVE